MILGCRSFIAFWVVSYLDWESFLAAVSKHENILSKYHKYEHEVFYDLYDSYSYG